MPPTQKPLSLLSRLQHVSRDLTEPPRGTLFLKSARQSVDPKLIVGLLDKVDNVLHIAQVLRGHRP